MKYRVCYLRDTKGNPIGCIATELKRTHSGGFVAQYQYSVLNPMDQFKREVARCIAKGRLTEKPLEVRLPDLPSNHEITRAIMQDILVSAHSPSRARKSANHWLRKAAQVDKAMEAAKAVIEPTAAIEVIHTETVSKTEVVHQNA